MAAYCNLLFMKLDEIDFLLNEVFEINEKKKGKVRAKG
jgi:hypothetical protein